MSSPVVDRDFDGSTPMTLYTVSGGRGSVANGTSKPDPNTGCAPRRRSSSANLRAARSLSAVHGPRPRYESEASSRANAAIATVSAPRATVGDDCVADDLEHATTSTAARHE